MLTQLLEIISFFKMTFSVYDLDVFSNTKLPYWLWNRTEKRNSNIISQTSIFYISLRLWRFLKNKRGLVELLVCSKLNTGNSFTVVKILS